MKDEFNVEVLKRLYVMYDIPLDTLITCKHSWEAFEEDYLLETKRRSVNSDLLKKKMLNLRKRGLAKGGLPRIRKFTLCSIPKSSMNINEKV